MERRRKLPASSSTADGAWLRKGIADAFALCYVCPLESNLDILSVPAWRGFILSAREFLLPPPIFRAMHTSGASDM
jgi:hypothetical protein